MADIATLGDWIIRIDRSAGPPYSHSVWNNVASQWDAVGTPARGVLYEYGPHGPEFVLTSEGDVIGIRE